MFIYYSSERDIIFNVVNKNVEPYITLIIKKIKLECLCQIKRDEMNENDEKNCLEKMFDKDENKQYKKYTMKITERIGLKFDIFEKFNKINNTIEIFLCDHIKKSDFLIFYEFIISYYLPVICSLNANLNLVYLKKIVFIFPKIGTGLIFNENLAKINEFIFFEKNDDEKYAVHAIKEEDLNIAEFIIKSLKQIHQQCSIGKSIKKNKNISKENENFYLKLLNGDNFEGKVRIITYFECKNKNLGVKCFHEYQGCFNNISISFDELNDKKFFTTENTILEENIKCIEITSSVIKSDFLKDYLNIKGLERLEINYLNIYIENTLKVLMGRKKNVSSEISKNTKIKAANDADEVKKSDSEVQKCKLHPPAISLPSTSYTTITPPPPSQTGCKMQNSGLDT
ncbi:hypothetical protein CWI36_1432p0020, partial [Hamiltosporidium magnivora]